MHTKFHSILFLQLVKENPNTFPTWYLIKVHILNVTAYEIL